MTIPSIPDSFYKILLTVGVAIILYAIYDFEKVQQAALQKQAEKDSTRNSLNKKINYNSYYLTKLKDQAEILSKRNKLENPINISDSVVVFNRVITGDPKSEKINDSIYSLYEKYKDANFEIYQLNKQLTENKEIEKLEDEIFDLQEETKNLQIFTGIAVILLGAGGIYRQQNLTDKLLKLQVAEKKELYDICQSCGKKFTLLNPRGSDNKGEKFDGFCINCYQNGAFVDPNLTKEKLYEDIITTKKVKSRLTKFLLKQRLNSLERWRKNEYL